MSKLIPIYLTCFTLCSLLFTKNVFSWNDSITHRDLSEYAAELSALSKTKGDYLKNLGFQDGLKENLKWINDKIITEWLQDGAELEDKSSFGFPWIPGSTTRSFNHFHNPLRPWDQAGLNDNWTGESSLLWALNGAYQENFPDRDWSWQKTSNYFYLALTSVNEEERQVNFARMFRGLGHQMHLLQDTAVPDHVRNDAHPEDEIAGKTASWYLFFENWAKGNVSRVNSFAANPIFPNLSLNGSYRGRSPITQFYDADKYVGLNASAGINQGLSEYTNANFFSNDTLFAAERYQPDHKHYFPYPKKTSTNVQDYISQIIPLLTISGEDGVEDKSIYIKKISDGETIEHFVRPSRWTPRIYSKYGESSRFYESFYRDDKCHEDYASLLIPRAVGYSAGLLNYFFRGTLEITPPGTYVYSVIDGSGSPEFTKLKANVKNATPNEAIIDGSLTAVARYIKRKDYLPDLSNDPPSAASREDEFSYSVSEPLTLLPEEAASMNVHPTEFIFDFSNSKIPAGITDLYLHIVFKGTLGGEKNIAVAVGMKDLKEPSHFSFWNLTDRFSLNVDQYDPQESYHLYTEQYIMDTPKLAAVVDIDHDGIFNETEIDEPYIKPHTINFSIGFTGQYPPVEPVHTVAGVANLPDGRFIRLTALVEGNDNYVRLQWSDPIGEEPKHAYFFFPGIISQDIDGVFQTTAPISNFRRSGLTPIRHQFFEGIVRCEPLAIEIQTGRRVCIYPEHEAPSVDSTPHDADIFFP